MCEEIIDRIVRMTKEKGLKDKDIYDHIGVSQSTYSTWKKRKTAPLEYMKDIAYALDISRHYLETGEFDEQEEYSEILEKRPDLKRLLSSARDLSETKIEQIIKMIETFK